MPKVERETVEQEDEICGFPEQSQISDKNMTRLRTLASSGNPKIAELVLEVAQIRPYKKGRLKVLAKERRDLLDKLEETALIFAHHWDGDGLGSADEPQDIP